MLRNKGIFLLALLSAAVPLHAQQQNVVLPSGTELPIRFLQGLVSGRDTVGTRVVVQTMAPLASADCVIAPAYSVLVGRITESRAGRHFGRHGSLDIVFDSLRSARGEWLGTVAVIGELEYAKSRALHQNGKLDARGSSFLKRMSTAGVIGAFAATGLDEIPGALLGLYWVARHGPRARILAGESGRAELQRNLSVSTSECTEPRAVDPQQLPPIPEFIPRTTNHGGTAAGDPINFIVLGTRAQLDSAFAAAGWLQSESRKPVHLFEAVFVVVTGTYASHPSVSNQYFQGRAQDVTYELEGPNARYRHHIRFWQMQPNLWVGSATHDDGIFLKGATHRVDPNIDVERDQVVKDLEGGNGAHLLRYVTLPHAVRSGRLAHRQKFVSDGQSAVMQLQASAGPVSKPGP